MSSKSIRTPTARFTCQSCGRCCTMWAVTVDEQKVAALREHDWSHIGKGDPFLPNRGPGDPYRLRMVDGRCFFLDDDDRCHIHAEIGYEAKPAGCKAFPLHFTEVAGNSHARLSFWCPSVCADAGKRLRDQQRWLRATRKDAGDVKRTAPLQLDDELELSARELERIESQLKRWLEQQGTPIADRLAAGSALLARISASAADRGKRAVGFELSRAAEEGLAALAAAGREGGHARRGGPVLSLFLGADCAPGKLHRMGHFFGVRLFQLGVVKLSSRAVAAAASRSQLARVAFDPPLVNDALLTRYMLHKLESRRHLAGEATLVAGFNLLVAAYAVINLLARVRAAGAGREHCEDEDVERAVQAADLLVVEHTTIHHGPMFGQLVDAILSQPSLCASLLARLRG